MRPKRCTGAHTGSQAPPSRPSPPVSGARCDRNGALVRTLAARHPLDAAGRTPLIGTAWIHRAVNGVPSRGGRERAAEPPTIPPWPSLPTPPASRAPSIWHAFRGSKSPAATVWSWLRARQKRSGPSSTCTRTWPWATCAAFRVDLHADDPDGRLLPATHPARGPRGLQQREPRRRRHVRHEGRRLGARTDRGRDAHHPHRTQPGTRHGRARDQ